MKMGVTAIMSDWLTFDPDDPDQRFLNLCQSITHWVSTLNNPMTPAVCQQHTHTFYKLVDGYRYYECYFNLPFQFHPYINAFKKAVSQWQIGAPSDDLFTWTVRFFHNNLQTLNAQSRKWRTNVKRRSHNQYQSLQNYINGLFDRYSRLLVIRIDCSYTEATRHMDFELARIHRTCFFSQQARYRHLDDSAIFNDQVGFCWKLEWGADKLLHYHFLFFYDGSRVRQDITLANRLGQRWKWIVATTTPLDRPQVIGSTFNCNQRAFNHYRDNRNNALGMMAYNEDKRGALERVMDYLAKRSKSDEIVSLMVPHGYRTFGHGGIPEQSHRGRPRQNQR